VSIRSLVLWLFPLLTGVGVLNASTIAVTGFTQITGAGFYDAPASTFVASPTIGVVTITPEPTFLNALFNSANAPQYGPDVPGTGGGFGSDGVAGAVPLILNFSQPVAAFGATFVHIYPVFTDPSFTFPVSLRVFSGLDGTGTLLGSILDSAGGITFEGTPFADFRGLWSDSLDIRSAEIGGMGLSGGFLVDGYAISVVPTPEPIMGIATLFGLTGLGIFRRYAPKS